MRSWKCARCCDVFQDEGIFGKPYCNNCQTTLFVYEVKSESE